MAPMNVRARPLYPDRQMSTIRLQSSEPGGRVRCLAVSLLLIIIGPTISAAGELLPGTLMAWNQYVERAKARMNSRLDTRNHFLWVDEEPGRARKVRNGEILVTPVIGSGQTEVPNGLIHDWLGAAFFPGMTMEK